MPTGKITLADKVATAKQFIEQEGTLEKQILNVLSVADHWQNFVRTLAKIKKLWQKLVKTKGIELTRFAVEQQQKAPKKRRGATKKSQWASLQIQRLSLLRRGEPARLCSLEHPKQQTHQEVSLEEIDQAERELTEVEKRFNDLLKRLCIRGGKATERKPITRTGSCVY